MLFIIGMPGAGKSYWGKAVASNWGLPFTDLDGLIESGEGCSIGDLMTLNGEEGFREVENKYLKQVIESGEANRIVACGGGTPCFYNNMELMKNAGKVLYLQARVNTLMAHLNKDKHQRPLLQKVLDLETYLTQLGARREPYYRQAHFFLQADNISLTNFEQILQSCTNQQ